MPQSGETEEWTDRLVAECDAHCSNTLFDLVYAFLLGKLGQILVRPGVRSNGMSAGRHLFHDFRVPARVFADRKKDRLGALVGKGLEHSRRMTWPGPIVEGEYDLVVTQEIVGLEVFEAEARPSGRVDLDHTSDAECIRIIACRCCRRRRRGWRCRRRGGRRVRP